MTEVDQALGKYTKYCDGYGNPGASGSGYFVGLALGIGVAKLQFNHIGSSWLDSINAFDKAEVSDVNIGQMNMITVSSFCGPHGSFWGYHIAKQKNLYKKHRLLPKGSILYRKKSVPVYSAEPLIDATRELFGTKDKKKFPLKPGAHVPCAGKHITKEGPAQLYCGVGFGIAENGERDANLIMEDVGEIPYDIPEEERNHYKRSILENIAKSIMAVGKNQGVKYKEIFVDIKDTHVAPDEIGCALVAAPYFTLAQKAVHLAKEE